MKIRLPYSPLALFAWQRDDALWNPCEPRIVQLAYAQQRLCSARWPNALVVSLSPSNAALTRSGVAGTCVIRAPVAWRIALRIAGAVGTKAASPTPLALKGPKVLPTVLYDIGVDRRHIADDRDEIVLEVFGTTGNKFLHQRHTEPLCYAPVQLALNLRRIDRATYIGGGRNSQYLSGAEIDVDLDQGDLRQEAVEVA